MFDLVVTVDWSAASVARHGRDSIWVAVQHVTGTGTGRPTLHNPPTRHEAAMLVEHLLAEHRHRCILLGIDVGLGYPAGFVRAAHLGGDPPWLATWRHLADTIDDRADNVNNRFAVAAELNARVGDGPGPFWGTTSAGHVQPTLARTKAPGFPTPGDPPLAEFRSTEVALQRLGRRPASMWQLAGAGSVGSQSLTAIPIVHRLRHRHSERVRIWPFETGLVADPTGDGGDTVVVAEVWPSLVPIDTEPHSVRDARQVSALARHLAGRTAAGTIGALFAPDLPTATEQVVIAEEGWVLGVPGPGGPTPPSGQVTWMM